MPTANINKIRIHYDVRGVGYPLLLLHGLGSSGCDWQRQLPVFSRHFSVVTPCLRGFGLSEKPVGPLSIPQQAADILRLMDHLEIARCHLLGYSMGGAIAMQLAVDHADRVDRLVVVNSQPSFELEHWRRYLSSVVRLGMANGNGMDRLARFLSRRMFPRRDQKSLRQEMCQRYADNDQQAYLAALRGLAGWSVKDRVGRLDMPTLVIAGEHDYAPLSDKRRFVEQLPDGVLEIVKNSRHGTPFDQPDCFNALVLDFLQDGYRVLSNTG